MRRATAAWFFLVGVACWGRAEEAKIPLPTTLPQEVLAGTPPDVLDAALSRSR